MSKQQILLLGATGETGKSILNGLVEDGSFDLTLLIRPSSANKDDVKELQEKGFKTAIIDIESGVDSLAKAFSGFDTFISATGPGSQLTQLDLVEAAVRAGIKRFVPCGFITICPRGGIMMLRDHKEEVHDRMFLHKLPFTIIDVGYWHQISFPRLPSGKVNYASIRPNQTIHAGGDAPNLLTDLRDIGRYVALIVKDERTLNKRVVTYSDVLSENQIFDMLEEVSGEKIERDYMSKEDIEKAVKQAEANYEANPNDAMIARSLYGIQYINSKYVRVDNAPEVAKYLGYLDANELYPDFKPVKMAEFYKELLEGKGTMVYEKTIAKEMARAGGK
ncbi:NAD(P)-binding protein [Aulographum hederae CBS 113979]|uniref:NAD(P)-binding protein n=1 Tax=Aulographum hederae CBS 113979 TaxID=1176131 RepID=A0A6G1HEL2_9PEZI|nr:NAD(P)-binding protein [Aulographum hederae CBS 113979]